MELQGKQSEKEIRLRKAKYKKCLLTLQLKPLRSYVKRKHSVGKVFMIIAVEEKKLVT